MKKGKDGNRKIQRKEETVTGRYEERKKWRREESQKRKDGNRKIWRKEETVIGRY